MKIKSNGLSEEFKAIKAVGNSFGENRDCSVKAVALACGVDYKTAHDVCSLQGRKPGRGLRTPNVLKAVNELGFLATHIKPRTIIAKYPGVHKELKNVTTHHPTRFKEVWEDGKTYLMFVKGHVLTIVNGQVHDWTVGRAKRALSVYEITKEN